MPNPATRQLLRRHAVAFAVSFTSLTALLLANYAVKQLPQLGASGVRTATIVEALLLAVPFTAATTIPMAVFVAVLWVFTRLGREGVLVAARAVLLATLLSMLVLSAIRVHDSAPLRRSRPPTSPARAG